MVSCTRAGIAAVLSLCLYVYIVIYLRQVYENNKKLDQLNGVMEETEKYLQELQEKDRLMQMRLEHLRSIIK